MVKQNGLDKVYFGRGQWAVLNRAKGHSIAYGFSWQPNNRGAAFSRNAGSNPVTIYLRVERYEGKDGHGKEHWSREEIVYSTVGHARYFREADKLGRAGIREQLLGLVEGLKERIR